MHKNANQSINSSSGLKNLVYSEKPDLERIEQLLSYWCRPHVYRNGTMVSLIDDVSNNTDGCNDVRDLLLRYATTNELVIAALAGSCKGIQKAASNGMFF